MTKDHECFYGKLFWINFFPLHNSLVFVMWEDMEIDMYTFHGSAMCLDIDSLLYWTVD